MENQGYQFEAAEASFDLLVKRCRRHVSTPHFERIKYHVEVGDREAIGNDRHRSHRQADVVGETSARGGRR